jgi:hypothetical protein
MELPVMLLRRFSDVLCLLAASVEQAAGELSTWILRCPEGFEWPAVVILIEETPEGYGSAAQARVLLRAQCRERLGRELPGDGPMARSQRWSELDRLLSISSLERCAVRDDESLLDRVKPLLGEIRRRRQDRRQLWTLETLSHLIDGFCERFSKGTEEEFEPARALRERYWPGPLKAERHLLGEWIRLSASELSLEGGVAPLLGKVFRDDASAICHGRWP